MEGLGGLTGVSRGVVVVEEEEETLRGEPSRSGLEEEERVDLCLDGPSFFDCSFGMGPPWLEAVLVLRGLEGESADKEVEEEGER